MIAPLEIAQLEHDEVSNNAQVGAPENGFAQDAVIMNFENCLFCHLSFHTILH